MHICLTGDQWFLYRKLWIALFIKRDRWIPDCPLPVWGFSANVLAFMRRSLAFCMDELANQSKHIYVHMTIATKVDALMMSADMCMNNVTSACMASVAFITNAPCCTMIRMSTVSIWVSRYFRYYPDSNIQIVHIRCILK